MVDAVIGGGVLLLTLLGLRRGILREILGAGALAVATILALRHGAALSAIVSTELQTSAEVGYGVATAGIWIGVYLGIQVVGRILIARLKRAPADEGGISGAAQGAVSSLVRTVDRTLGAGLGLAKGALYASIILFLGLDAHVGWLEARLAPTISANVYRRLMQPIGDLVPEIRMARSVGCLRRIRAGLKTHPDRVDRVVRHPAVLALLRLDAVQALRQDKDLQAAVKEGRLDRVLRSPRVLALLKDRRVRQELAKVPFDEIVRDVEASGPPAWLFPAPGHQPSDDLAGGFEVGDERIVTVRELAPSGLVVTVDAETDALLRTEDLSWSSLQAPADDLLPPGTRLAVKILGVGESAYGRRHLLVGRKQRTTDPWRIPAIDRALAYHEKVTGKVVRMGQTAILLELVAGVEAVIPATEIAKWKLAELGRGASFTGRITAFDRAARRVTLRPIGDERPEKR